MHALDALRENEERYRLLVERATDGIWLADEHGRYLDVNPAACEMLGYTRAEHLALRIADVVPPEELPRLTAQLQAMQDGQSLTEVWELRHRDGRWVPLELSMRSAGHGRLQAVGRDITARRRAEVEREELLERERAANHRLRLLQDATAALSAAATPEQVGAIMIAQLRQLLDVESVAAWELRDGVLVGLEMHNWQDGAQERWRRMPLDAGNPVTDAVCRGEQVWLADEGDWGERYPAQRASLQRHGYTGLACLPLMVGESCVGVVIATFTASRTPGPAERATATTLAGQCAQAMHRAGLLGAERRARRSAERFAEVVAALSGATRPADVVEIILGQARALSATGCAVVLHRAGRLEVAGRYGACDALPAAATDDHPLARAVRTRDPQWTSIPLAVPLPLSDRAIGAVGLWFADGPPTSTTTSAPRSSPRSSQCAQALDRARLHQA